MRYFILLMAFTFSLWACKNDKSSGQQNENGKVASADEAYTPFDKKTDRPIVYSNNWKSKQYEYKVNFRGGNIDAASQIIVKKNGKTIYNKDERAAGKVSKAFLQDLNNDGNEDLFIYSNTEDETNIGYGFGVVMQGDSVHRYMLIPNLDPKLSKGYFGRDSFYLEGDQIIRVFPIWSLNKYNQKSLSGSKRYITYKWDGKPILQPISQEDRKN